jgi:hypothetical protein
LTSCLLFLHNGNGATLSQDAEPTAGRHHEV